ncbi:DUF84 family protein [Candidatus Woesebacteria bacterium]|nr:DUF84 family protein [Candidatus Woesebacteria bacterium]
MTIFVGSTNPVKINAVKAAVQQQWPEAEVVGLAVSSGVSDQPMGDEETRAGARQRAQAALTQGLAKTATNDQEVLGVGLEGGVTQLTDGLYSTVWVSVVDQTGVFFDSNGARFRVPDSIAKQILAGTEMGEVVSQMFNGANIKQGNGAIGVITKDFVDRTTEYTGIAKLAIGLWFGQDWEQDLPPKSGTQTN